MRLPYDETGEGFPTSVPASILLPKVSLLKQDIQVGSGRDDRIPGGLRGGGPAAGGFQGFPASGGTNPAESGANPRSAA